MQIKEYLKYEDQISIQSLASFEAEIKVFDLWHPILKGIFESVRLGNDKTKNIEILPCHLLFQIHIYLRHTFIMVLRGHYFEQLTLLRTAIETTAHLHIMCLDPNERCALWLNQDEKEKEYERVFKKTLFPKSDKNLTELGKIYGMCCRGASHPTTYSLLNKFKFQKKESGGATIDFMEFNATELDSRRNLCYILTASQLAARVCHGSFKSLFGESRFKPLRKAFKDLEILTTDILYMNKDLLGIKDLPKI